LEEFYVPHPQEKKNMGVMEAMWKKNGGPEKGKKSISPDKPTCPIEDSTRPIMCPTIGVQ
jgi:hypothetical protein